jgi:long-chain fatty acid transport protein
MKRTIKLAVAAAIALSGTAAFATNGDHLIGMGAKARGMGGIGIGMSHGAETALSNPALITSVKGVEVSFGGTLFMPNVETSLYGASSIESDADLSMIPEVAIAQKASDSIWWGIGMYGVAGMGTDYRDAVMSPSTGVMGNFNMVTNLQLMQFAVPLAYKADGFSIGVAPVIQYGSLDINYRLPNSTGGLDTSATQGVAQDFGFGYNIGAAYEMAGLTLGASYKSAIDMEYKGQISKAAVPFGLTLSDNLEQPAEMGIGASYAMDGHTFAVDYKQIKWASAKGYEQFGWDDQNVYIFGYQFAQDNWALRAGYNHAKSPIKDNGLADGGSTNVLNLLGFPAIVEDHYTVGASYGFSKMTSLDLAYVYVPETTEKFNVMMQTPTGYVPSTIETKHSQQAASVQVNFNF